LTLVAEISGRPRFALNGSLSGTPGVGTFQFYWTDIVSGNFFKRGSDAVVTNGAFASRRRVNSFFTLTAPGTP